MARPAGDDGTPEQAVALKPDQQLGRAVRRLGPDQPAADTQRREIRLVAGAPGELGGAVDQALGVECGADDGLGVQVNDGTLLYGDRFIFSRDLSRSGRFLRRWASFVSEHRKELY